MTTTGRSTATSRRSEGSTTPCSPLRSRIAQRIHPARWRATSSRVQPGERNVRPSARSPQRPRQSVPGTDTRACLLFAFARSLVKHFPSAQKMDYRFLFDVLARAFVEHYYWTFDSNPQALGGLYLDRSMLTFDGELIQGAAAIVAKLTSHPFQQCARAISTIDCQPSGPSGAFLIFVSGFLQLGGEQHPLKFSRMFHLIPTPQGSFCVLNDMFRLNGWFTAGPPV